VTGKIVGVSRSVSDMEVRSAVDPVGLIVLNVEECLDALREEFDQRQRDGATVFFPEIMAARPDGKTGTTTFTVYFGWKKADA
jgi:hypothetical protein